jgi:hypothetical protein
MTSLLSSLAMMQRSVAQKQPLLPGVTAWQLQLGVVAVHSPHHMWVSVSAGAQQPSGIRTSSI